jgi:NADPH-dependent ferric siderophore reductase
MTLTQVAPWRLFTVEVRGTSRLSPSFLRVTLTGPDLDRFADNGYDQRIKLVFPLPGNDFADLPTGPDWFPQWRALPDHRRNPIRTYTVRAVRPGARELDVDMVLHGDGGPASRWAEAARPGDPLAVIGPDAGYPGDHGGVEFRPPADAGLVLLAGDETAVPAVAAILERLPGNVRGEALLEVPDLDDRLPLIAPPGVRVGWLPRFGAGHGSQLIPAVRSTASRLLAGATPRPRLLPEADPDEEPIWEVPEQPSGGLYAWLAGEAGTIRTLRRQLVGELGLDRRSVAFMGYWRLGRPEI